MMRFCVQIFVFFLIANEIGFLVSSKLNVPRVLLPYFETFSTNFTLEVTEGGCYKWSSSRMAIVQVTPVDVDPGLGCSARAVVSSVSKDKARNTAIIFAEEVHSGQLLRCDVIVDVICSLFIITTTRELYMEEAPEIFEVRAYDEQGNEFSTLEGVEFLWTLATIGSMDDLKTSSKVLRFITFRDSPYETPPAVDKFEQSGRRGNMVLLEGSKTGSAKVSVRLPHQEYSHVSPIEVQLMVVANLIIDPADVYIMPCDTVLFQILQVQSGRLSRIPLPSPQYYLEVQDPSVAAISDEGLATGRLAGKSRVLLHDRNVEDKEIVKMPSVSITVVKPYSVSLAVLPHRNWALLVRENCQIVVEIYDRNDHKLHIGSKTQVAVEIPAEYFHVEESTKNKTHNSGWPVQVGTAVVKAELLGVHGCASGTLQSISAQAEMFIFDKIVVVPSQVVLPWDPLLKPRYEVKLSVTGGDGDFLWSSSNVGVAAVTQSGVINTQSLGVASIIASMTRNQHNRGVARVWIVPPTDLKIVSYIMEAELGTPVYLHVALFVEKRFDDEHKLEKDAVRMSFTRCGVVPFEVVTSNDNFAYNPDLKITPLNEACTTLAIVGTVLGVSRVTISYVLEDGRRLSDTVAIATYLPLKAVHPRSGETVLAVGSSRMIAFAGGPQPWLDAKAKHTKKLSLSGGTAQELRVNELNDVQTDKGNLYVYKVVCLTLGSFDVTLHVSNILEVENSKPSSSRAFVKVYCAKPRHNVLYVKLDPHDADRCLLKANSDKVVVHNYKEFDIDVVVQDAKGRKFDNVSSLHFDWIVSNISLARILKKDGVYVKDEFDGDILMPGNSYQILAPSRQPGVIEVSSIVSGYHKSTLLNADFKIEKPPFGTPDANGYLHTPEIKGTITVILVDNISVFPTQTTIFNHPDNKVKLMVIHGSGFFNITVNTPKVASLQYVQGSRVIEVTPENDGLLKLAIIDLCLKSEAALAEITVLGLGAIEVNVLDKVERGSFVRAIVRLFDSVGNALAIPGESLLELRALPGAPIISVEREVKCDDCAAHEMSFIVTGVELGDTILVFTSEQGKHAIRSRSVPIQVFPPLKLFPRNLTLIMRSSFQVTSRGGPQPDCDVEYSVGTHDIASVSTCGIVKGVAFGKTVVTGRAVGINTMNGQKIVYSEDSIDVFVVPLKGIKIFSPLRRLKVGCSMPVYATGLPDISPLILGSVSPPIYYKWGVHPKDVAVLENVFESLHVKYRDEDKIYLHLKVLKVGRVTLSLNASVPSAIVHGTRIPTEPLVIFHDSVDVHVFSDLKLLMPASVAVGNPYRVLMAPDTQIQLKTNRDGAADMFYNVQHQVSHFQDASTALENTTRPSASFHVVSVDKNGLVKANGWLGHSFIMVTALEDSNVKQSFTIAAVVEQVSYMMVNVRANFIMHREQEAISALPKGVDVEVYVTYHDNVGNRFTSVRSDLKVCGNRLDISDARRGSDNCTLVVQLLQPGKSVLKLWDSRVVDFLPLRVAEAIYPALTHLTIGDVVCFSSAMMRPDGKPGLWNTSDMKMLKLDPFVGIGKAKLAGSVTVRYRLADDFDASTLEIEIVPVDSIKFLPMPGMGALSNSRPDMVYSIPLLLSSKRDVNKANNIVARNNTCHSVMAMTTYPFMCELKFDSPVKNLDVMNIFAVHQAFDSDTGTYQCRIIPSGLLSYNVSVLNTNFSLFVMRNGVKSPPLHIPFVPAVFLHTTELQLSDLQVVDLVTISGRRDVLSQVQVLPGNDLLLSVDAAEFESDTRVSFRVYLKPYYWQLGELSTHLSVFVVSDISYQNVEVPVKVRLSGSPFGGSTCVVPRFVSWMELVYFWKDYLKYFVAIVLIVVGTWYVFSKLHPVGVATAYNVSGQSNYADTPQALMAQSLLRSRAGVDTSASQYGTVTPTTLHRSRRFL
ncbi:nuclear pore membrane glycoprotein 210-like [Bacillus rossius redtenbacheri]|uniref:nuclear pore membrane glycoprotein 210-like n=1 Tax=Bacillus rossius redtenbacheri TaxID=93214 RepID=UPI002FDD9A7C